MANSLEDGLAEVRRAATTEFEDMEAERLHRKQRLAAGLRTMGRLHLAEGVAGMSRYATRSSPIAFG